MSAGRSGRARTDDRGNSVWEFVDEQGLESTARTERVLALGDGLSLADTAIERQSAPAAAAAAPPAPPPPPRSIAPETRAPRKPLSRQELHKLSEQILRQRALREAALAAGSKK